MSSVDNKVVELVFDNRQFEAGVAQSLATLEKLKKEMDFSSASKSMGDLSAATKSFDMGNLGTVVEGVSAKFLALATIGVTALANITNKAIETGTQIVKSLTLTPVTTGFSEYELKMGAIQTIMAGSGDSLKTVNGYLAQLNEYSDKTIYSFSDMTQNIGKFTNAGVSLKDSVAAIQGIANVAAVSGANAGEASRAMYNFSQALSKGSVALIDWKSIEMANMGTVEFKQQLIDAAVAQGTLTKVGKEYKTEKGKMISATKGFNDSLSDEWLSTKVLTKTLGDYSNEQTAIGKKATAAAQDVKTLSQMYDTLKEAAGSGWAETWELMFGNLNAAKKRWTNLNNVISGWIKTSADNRNEMIRQWKALGGLNEAIRIMKDSFKVLASVFGPIRDAWREVFPPKTAQELYDITHSIHQFVHALILGPEAMENLKRVFKGLFSILDIGKTVLGGVFHFFVGLFDMFREGAGNAGGGLLGLVASVADLITNFAIFLKTSGAITKFFDNLLTKIQPAVEWIKELGNQITDTFEKVPALFKQTGGAAGEANEELSPLQKTIIAIKDAWDKFVNAIKATLSFFGDIGGAIADAFSNTGQGISDGFSGISDALHKLDWATIFKVGVAGGLLTVSGIFLKGLYGAVELFLNKPGKIMESIRGIFQGLEKVVGDFRGLIKTYQQQLKAKTLLMIAGAIVALAIGLKLISTIPAQELAQATVAMGALFAMLTIAMKQLGGIVGSKGFVSIPKIALGFLLIGGSMILLATAMKIIGTMPIGQVVTSLVTIGVLLAGMAVFGKMFAKIEGDVLRFSAGMLVLSFALITLSGALLIYSNLDTDTIVHGSLAIAGVLLVIGTAMKAMPKSGQMIKSAAGLLIISFAMVILASAMAIFANMSLGDTLQAMWALGGTITILVAAMLLASVPGVLMGAAALLVAAGAIMVLALALQVVGSMSLGEIVTAILGIVAAMAIIALTAVLLSPAIPILALFGAALLLLGAGMALFGLGALAFASAMNIVFAIVSLGAPVLADALNNIIKVIPLFGEMLYRAIAEFLNVIIRVTPKIVRAGVTLINSFLDGVTKVIPHVMELLGTFLDNVMTFLIEYIPKLVTTGLAIINGLLEGIANGLPDIIQNGTDIIVAWIEGIGNAALQIVTAAGDTLIRFLEGLTSWIEQNAPRLNQAGVDLVNAIIDGMLDGVGALGGAVVDRFQDMAGNIISGVGHIFGIGSPSRVFRQIGKWIMQGLVQGIVGGRAEVQDTLNKITEDLRNAKKDIVQTIKDLKADIQELKAIEDPTKKDLKQLEKSQKQLKAALAEQRKINAAIKEITKDQASRKQELLDLGSDYDRVTKKLEAAEQKYKDAVKERDDYARSIKESYSKLPDITEETTLDTYFDQIRKATAANNKFKQSLNTLRKLGLDDTSYRKFLEQGVDAQPFLDALIASGGSTITELSDIDHDLAASAASLGTTAAKSLYQAGVDSARGLRDGFRADLKEITKDMKKLGKAIADALKAELGIKSPSKIFAEIGKFSVQGLAKGMEENAKVIDISAKKIGETAVDSLKKTLSDLAVAIDSDVNLEPVIAPVLDLDKFRKDAGAVTDILTPGKVSPTTSAAKARDISTTAAQQRALQDQAEGKGTILEYNQYNTSPKALSTAELYRQTKNQLSTVKEALR